MRRIFTLSAPEGRARFTARRSLSVLFVLAAVFCINNVSLLSQSFGQGPQNADSVNADDLTKDSGSAKSSNSTGNNVVDPFESTRLVRRDDGALVSLDTSVVRYSGQYQGSDGTTRDVTVDLVGAIHIAEPGYYEEINELFKDYDTVVFELVSDTDDVAALMRESRKQKKEKRNLNPLNFISYFQEDVGKLFKLSYQIDGIDYTAKNMRRGDCTSVEFITWTITNGDVGNFFLNIFAQSLLGDAPGTTEGAIVAILCSKDRRLAGKRLFALELADSSIGEVQQEVKALGDDSGTVKPHETAIIHLRNKKALSVVRQELDAGREHVALFYGAAHLPDLGQRLESDFQLKRDPETRWFKAWDLERVGE